VALTRIASLENDARVKLVDAYGDGTIWASIEDGQGHCATVCIDGRRGSPTRHRLFELARHPRQQGAVLIDFGAPEEGFVVPLLSRWLDSREPREVGLTEYGKEFIQAALLRLGEPAGTGGTRLLAIVVPRPMEASDRQAVERGLAEALAAGQLGQVTGGGFGGGITDFFVGVVETGVGLSVIRRVLSQHPTAAGAIIREYEPTLTPPLAVPRENRS
jgi:hypothetical protein